MSSFFSWWDNDTRRGTFTFEVDGNDRQSIQVHFGKGSDISLKDPFIKAVEKARELGVYPCSADDIDELIYQISRKDGEDPLTIGVREDAKKMLIRDVLRRVRWNNGDKLKVTLVMCEKQCSMSVYTDTRSHNLQKKLQDSKNPNAVEPDKAPMREYENQASWVSLDLLPFVQTDSAPSTSLESAKTNTFSSSSNPREIDNKEVHVTAAALEINDPTVKINVNNLSINDASPPPRKEEVLPTIGILSKSWYLQLLLVCIITGALINVLVNPTTGLRGESETSTSSSNPREIDNKELHIINDPIKINVDNLYINACAESGRIELRNAGQSNIDVRMDGLQEVNHDGLNIGETESFKRSIFHDENEEEDIPLFPYMMGGSANTKTTAADVKNVAKGNKISLSTRSPVKKCNFKINAIAITESGEAGTDAESWSVVRGDFMFTIEISEWPWSGPAAGGDEGDNAGGAYLDLDVEINTFGFGVQTALDHTAFAYELGDDARLLLTNRYFEFDEVTQSYQQRFMPKGFPKITKGDDSKYIFTFRFLRFKTKIFYDPIMWFWDNRHGTFEVRSIYSGREEQVHFGKAFGGIPIQKPFIEAMERAKDVYPPHSADEDMGNIRYQILDQRINNVKTEQNLQLRQDDAKTMRIKDVLKRVRWNEEDYLKVKIELADKIVHAAEESLCLPRTTELPIECPTPTNLEDAEDGSPNTLSTPPTVECPITQNGILEGSANRRPITTELAGKEENDQIPNSSPAPEAVGPENCTVMISFNDAASRQDAKDLANYLTSKGYPTFCTCLYCPKHAGDWRKFTEAGATNCRYYIPLMTDRWQLSDECQIETNIVKNRISEVTVIPVFYKSFDAKYDNRFGHHYLTTWKSFQGVPNKEKDPDWKNTILNLLPPISVLLV